MVEVKGGGDKDWGGQGVVGSKGSEGQGVVRVKGCGWWGSKGWGDWKCYGQEGRIGVVGKGVVG